MDGTLFVLTERKGHTGTHFPACFWNFPSAFLFPIAACLAACLQKYTCKSDGFVRRSGGLCLLHFSTLIVSAQRTSLEITQNCEKALVLA